MATSLLCQGREKWFIYRCKGIRGRFIVGQHSWLSPPPQGASAALL